MDKWKGGPGRSGNSCGAQPVVPLSQDVSVSFFKKRIHKGVHGWGTEDWKCEVDKDKKYDNGTWLCASNKAIEYQMDPRNILNDENIFQFEQLRYVENAQTEDGIKEITEGTFLEGDNISKALIQAGKKADLDPYFIAARLIQEQGKNGTVLVNGYEYNEVTVYNPFNINAKGNSQDEILENAAQYAFEHGWSSLEKALLERNRLYEKRVYK